MNPFRILPLISLLLLLDACTHPGPSNQSAGAAPDPASCQFVQDGWGPTGSVPLKVEKVVSGLEVPWAVAYLPNGDWLVTERPGRVRLVRAGQLVSNPVVTIQVGEQGEGGLLGLALHPQFASNRQFYVFYTLNKNSGAVNRVERYTLSEDHRTASADQVIIDDIPAGVFHDGGRIHFGPDGMLYIGTGDARTPDSSQDISSRNGKLLRLTPEGGVPSDNPTPGNPAFASGLRNPEAFDWARPDLIIVADHGPSGELGLTGLDRVGFISRGTNLGWPLIPGCGTRAGLTSAALSWSTAAPPGGGIVYRGAAIPEFNGNFIIGMLGTEPSPAHQLHRVVFDPSSLSVTSHEVYLQNQFGRLRDVSQGPDGALYVTTSNCDGRGTCPPEGDSILRITHG